MVEAAAGVLLQDYASQYDAAHLSWRDFADLAERVLSAASSVPLAHGHTAYVVVSLLEDEPGTLQAITESPDSCLSDGELAIRAEVMGVVDDRYEPLLPYLTGNAG